MRKLIIVRHGSATSKGYLSIRGTVEMRELAEKLKKYTDNHDVRFISSPEERVSDSAENLNMDLGGTLTLDLRLEFSENDVTSYDLHSLLDLVKENVDADVLVLVTHYPYTLRFPEYFGRVVLNTPFPSGGLECGQAWIIDCEEKTLTHLG